MATTELIQELDQLEFRVKLLERQQSMLVDAIALMLEGRWTGELPHAAAEIKAINPAWEGTPVPFPESRA